jgi:hypothetical protein
MIKSTVLTNVSLLAVDSSLPFHLGKNLALILSISDYIDLSRKKKRETIGYFIYA